MPMAAPSPYIDADARGAGQACSTDRNFVRRSVRAIAKKQAISRGNSRFFLVAKQDAHALGNAPRTAAALMLAALSPRGFDVRLVVARQKTTSLMLNHFSFARRCAQRLAL
jgi:hypothetical protein